MEKTLNYALNEALETGYRAGRLGNSFDEVALRERIAQEIEKLLCDSNCLGVNQEHCDNIKESIAVVRGKNDRS